VTCTFTNIALPKLTVKKVTAPTTDGGSFNLNIDSTTKATGGNGTTTGAQTLSVGSHTVAETGAGGTLLTSYSSTLACATTVGGKLGRATRRGRTKGTLLANNGDDVSWTCTNRALPQLTVKKVTAPTHDSGRLRRN